VTYPDPDDSDPATRNGTNAGEAPVSVQGDDGRDKLGNAEGDKQSDGGTLHEESMRTCDEDEGLGDDCNLEVDDHVEHAIVGEWDTWSVLEVDAEFILEESGLQDDNDKDMVDRVRYKPSAMA